MKKNVDDRIKEPDALIKGRDEFKAFLKERLELANEIAGRTISTNSYLEICKKDASNWDVVNSEYLKHAFNNEQNEYRREYDGINRHFGIYDSAMGIKTNPVQDFKKMLQNKIEVLTQLNLKSDYLKSKIEIPTTATSAAQKASTSNNDNIFIVHGHNHEIQQTVARAIEKLGLNPIILGDQPSLGNTVIEKFEKYSDVGFAIVLLTDDDLGKAKMQNDLNKRARQNVIMELGFFFGKLGRGRVLPLYMEGVELPSDINGLVFTAIDTSGRWQFEIVKELKALGYDVDANKLL